MLRTKTATEARVHQPELGSAAGLLRLARQQEQAGNLVDAAHAYAAAIAQSEQAGDQEVLAEALRWRAVLHHQANEPGDARRLCTRSYTVAIAAGDRGLASAAMNVLGGLEVEGGALGAARETFHQALGLAGDRADLHAKIEQNLGIVANIQGDIARARAHYTRSLHAYEQLGDAHGCAIVYHNLGMVSADQKLWHDADRYYRLSHDHATATGDPHLRGLCLLNHAEVHLALGRYDTAHTYAKQALGIFEELRTSLDLAPACRVLGLVYQQIGQPTLAESHFRSAIELAASTGSILSEGEAARDLARLYVQTGHHGEALPLVSRAHHLFCQLDARGDLADLAATLAQLEATYLAVARERVIEPAGSYTAGHSERVARYALAVAQELGLSALDRSTVHVAAHVHDIGKARVPRQILDKPGSLSDAEWVIVRRHPVWGVEMLAELPCPWEIGPLVRWHHEKVDGSGYPDGLRGGEIPIGAQVICIADVYDALTTTRSYRPAMSPDQAVRTITASAHCWRPDVFAAFMSSVAPNPRRL